MRATKRVVQWSTGNVGRLATRVIAGHPDLELVGLIVHNPAKAGRDAAELVGLDEPLGVRATTDVGEVLALEPDCLCYTATGDLRPGEAIDDMARALAAGINVVSTSVVPLVDPGSAHPAWTRQLADAAAAGGASFLTSGIDPGFANDTLPATLLSVAERADRVHVMEILNYDTYDQPEVLFGTMGFGQREEVVPLLLQPGVLGMAWGGVVHLLGRTMGVTVEDLRERYERVVTDEAFTVPSGSVDAGTVAGLRFWVEGLAGGEVVATVEHVTRLRDDIAPHWPQPAGRGSYRIEVEGSPSMRCEVEFTGTDGDPNTGGVLVTATRVVNAIPAVCDAAPGLLTALDLPLVRPPAQR